MASLQRTRQTVVALLGGAMLATSAQAQAPAPTAPQDAGTVVRDVTVVGGRIAPNSDEPRSATCEFLVAIDPVVRAQIAAAQGDPLMGPTIYQPTRFPRIVQFGAEPLSAPGSALPPIPRQFRGISASWAPTGQPMPAPSTRPILRRCPASW